MVTNWTVAPAGVERHDEDVMAGRRRIGGFFGTFAPLGLRKIQAEVLANFKVEAR